ncbi:MAG TPA: hypothetical protein VHG32_25515 [Thermoanaerobaculia bacterium]|jgi:hypothetical protein|nr:hypothetical protein [Thermoanaerobaculia bacterium]
MLAAETVAEIRRLYYAEHWRIGRCGARGGRLPGPGATPVAGPGADRRALTKVAFRVGATGEATLAAGGDSTGGAAAIAIEPAGRLRPASTPATGREP